MSIWSSRRSVVLRKTRIPLLSVSSVPPSPGYSRRATTVLHTKQSGTKWAPLHGGGDGADALWVEI
jgi:hypothetical protein